MHDVNILTEPELRDLLTLDRDIVTCVEDAFKALATKPVVMPPVLHLEIAEANGSSGEELIAYLVGVVDERLSEAVAAGRITEEQKAEALERATDAITTAVNTVIERPLAGPQGHSPHGPGESGPPSEGAVDGASA